MKKFFKTCVKFFDIDNNAAMLYALMNINRNNI